MINLDNTFLAGNVCSKLSLCKACLDEVKNALLEVDAELMNDDQKSKFADLLTNMEWLDVDMEDGIYLCGIWFDSMNVEIGGVRND